MSKGKNQRIASVRDGGIRAASYARDLADYGAQMLALWPELAVNLADGHASWAAFNAGAAEKYDADNAGVIVVRDDKGVWTPAPEGYKLGSQSDQTINAAWVRGISRTRWSEMKKDSPELYAVALSVRGPVTDAISEARRVLRDAVRKALTGTGRKSKGANRDISQWLADEVSKIDAKIKTSLSRKSIEAEQADTIRAWLRNMPKV